MFPTVILLISALSYNTSDATWGNKCKEDQHLCLLLALGKGGVGEGGEAGHVTEVKLSNYVQKPKCLPQMSYSFGAHQREDDVVILLTLKPVHCCYLQKNITWVFIYLFKCRLCCSLLTCFSSY